MHCTSISHCFYVILTFGGLGALGTGSDRHSQDCGMDRAPDQGSAGLWNKWKWKSKKKGAGIFVNFEWCLHMLIDFDVYVILHDFIWFSLICRWFCMRFIHVYMISCDFFYVVYRFCVILFEFTSFQMYCFILGGAPASPDRRTGGWPPAPDQGSTRMENTINYIDSGAQTWSPSPNLKLGWKYCQSFTYEHVTIPLGIWEQTELLGPGLGSESWHVKVN
jgi:hypothetical protein